MFSKLNILVTEAGGAAAVGLIKSIEINNRVKTTIPKSFFII